MGGISDKDLGHTFQINPEHELNFNPLSEQMKINPMETA